MTNLRTLLLSLAAMFALCTSAFAQLPPAPPAPTSIVGNYEMLNLDGTSVVPGGSLTMDISVQNGATTGVVKLNGTANPSETTTFELINGNPLLYTWTNVKGNSGLAGWNAAAQRFEIVIITGPNSGAHAILCPR